MFKVMIKYLLSRTFFILSCLTCLVIFLPAVVYAQEPTTTNTTQAKTLESTSVYQVADDKIESGDIVVMGEKGIERASVSLSPRIFGVMQENPMIVYREVDATKKPVAREGVAEVNITTINGPIKPGDFITSSDIAGKGQKASYSGYVIGVALSEFKEGDGTQIDYTNPKNPQANKKVSSGKINVSLNIGYVDLVAGGKQLSNLLGPLAAPFAANVQDPDKFTMIIRYIAAGLIVLVGFLISFFAFSRSLPKAIEAIGRNPLARSSIYFSIGVNIFFAVLTLAIAVAAAIILVKV